MVMYLIGLNYQIVGYLLDLLTLRFFLDIFLSFARGFRPRGPLLWLMEIVLTITDWLLKPVRKLVKPVRIFSVAFDLSYIVAVFLLLTWENLFPYLMSLFFKA